MNIKFDLENKKGIIIAGIFVFVVALLFQFVYFPKSRQVRRLSSEYKNIKQDIDGLYNFIGTEGNLEENIIERRRDLAILESAFPFEKEVSNVIKQLNDQARHFNVNVISLKPEDLLIYKDHEGKEVKVSDYFCKCMPLTLNVESRYKALGEFLLNLETNRSPIVTIEKVDIKKDEDKAPATKAEIRLTAYILGK